MNNTWCNILLGLIAILIGLLAFVDQITVAKYEFLKTTIFKILCFVVLSIIGVLVTIRKDNVADASSRQDADEYRKQIETLREEIGKKNEKIEELNTKSDTLLELTRKKEREIEELKNKSGQLVDKVNNINSAEIRIEIQLPILTPSESYGRNIGIGSAIALFDENQYRIRFVTDGTWEDSKGDNGFKKLSFLYRPESPEQILGKDILYVNNFKMLGVDFSEFLSISGNHIGEFGVVSTNILINNVSVFNSKSQVSGKHLQGQLTQTVDLSKAKTLLLEK